jgi:hypothetical protein
MGAWPGSWNFRLIRRANDGATAKRDLHNNALLEKRKLERAKREEQPATRTRKIHRFFTTGLN